MWVGSHVLADEEKHLMGKQMRRLGRRGNKAGNTSLIKGVIMEKFYASDERFLDFRGSELRYNRCLRCGRKLKTDEARQVGYGTICMKKMQSEKKVKRLF